MMSTLQERFALAIKHFEKTTGKKFVKAHLARFCGVSPPAVTEWIDKNVQTLEQKNVEPAAKFFGVNHRWLNGLSSSMLEEDEGTRMLDIEIGGWQDGDPIPDGYVALDFYDDVHVSAGNGYLNSEYNAPKKYLLPTELIKDCNVNAELANVLPVYGESMFPELRDGQLISIDASAKRIFDGEIYAFCVDGEIKIKYLFNWNDEGKGGFKSVSRNDDKTRYPDEYYSPERIEIDKVFVIGQQWWKQETKKVRR